MQVLGSISLGLLLRNHNILFILSNLEPCGTSLRLQDGDNGHGEELTATGNSREQSGWPGGRHSTNERESSLQGTALGLDFLQKMDLIPNC